MTRRKFTEKEKLRSFLKEVIPDAEKALKKLYPTRKQIFKDGQERLHLLYFPLKKIDPKGRDYPIPSGDAYYEWEYLAGEVFKWDWKKIAKLNDAKDFPPRNPPFPVPKFSPSPIEGKRRANKVPISPYLLRKGFPRTFWLLFINQIPKQLWTQILLKLVNHDFRLKRLSYLYRRNRVLEEIKNGLLPKEKELAYLNSLLKLRGDLKEQDKSKLVEHTSGLIELIHKNDCLTRETVLPQIEEEQKKIENDWKKHRGPTKKYTKDAIYYISPLVPEFEVYFSKHLRANKYRNKIGYKFIPRWIGTLDDCPIYDEIYRIIGDIIRFFFIWEEFTSSELGIELPEWGEDLFRLDIPKEKRSQFVKAGKKMRNSFGDRIKKIVS